MEEWKKRVRANYRHRETLDFHSLTFPLVHIFFGAAGPLFSFATSLRVKLQPSLKLRLDKTVMVSLTYIVRS